MRCLCASVFLIALAAPAPADEKASVRVEHHAGFSVGVGTGTVVAVEDGVALIVTNRHVCPSPAAVVVVWPDGHRAFARWLGVDAQADLCALEAVAPKDCPACPPAASEPRPGEAVAFYGYRGGFRPLKRLGAFLGFGGFAGSDPVYMVGVPSAPGDSGAGLVNEKGELVGVVWGVDARGRANHVGRAAVVRFLRRLPLPRFVKFRERMLLIETPEPPPAGSPSAVCPPGR